MQNMTINDLATKTSQLVKTLKKGGSINVMHESKVIGKIHPAIPDPKPFDVEGFKKAVKKLNLPKTTYEEREKRYRSHLMKKYGQGLSRY